MDHTYQNLTRRNIITREVFIRTLDELLKEKEFEEVSTSEIIKKSGLSRTTFYKHFHDKYELANYRLAEFLVSNGMQEFNSNSEIDRALTDIVQFLDQNKLTFKKLLKYEGQNSFGDFYIKSSINTAKQLADKYGRSFSAKDQAIVLYHAAAAVEVIKEWISEDSGLTTIEVIDIIIHNRSDAVKKLYLLC